MLIGNAEGRESELYNELCRLGVQETAKLFNENKEKKYNHIKFWEL